METSNDKFLGSLPSNPQVPKSKPQSNPVIPTQDNVDKALDAISVPFLLLARILEAPLRDGKPRVAIFGILSVYFFLINYESYCLAIPSYSGLPFVPKPFISDNADPLNFQLGLISLIAFFLCVAIQAVESRYWEASEEKSIKDKLAATKQAFEQVKNEKNLEAPTDAHQVTKSLAKKHNRVRLTVNRVGFLTIAAFMVDLITGMQNYWPFGIGIEGFVLNFFYLLICLVGCDYSISLFKSEFKKLAK